MGLMRFACLMVKNNTRKFIFYLLSVSISVAFIFINYNLLFNESIYAVSISSVMMGLIVMIAAMVFINFSNSYFIKSRTKEMAIVAIGGRSVYQIASINFVENLIIIGIATILGVGFSLLIIPIIFPYLFKLIGITDGSFIEPSAIMVVIFVVAIMFVQLMILNLGFFIRKEVREVIIEERNGSEVFKKEFEKKMILYLILYLLPVLCFLLPVPIKDVGQYIAITSVVSIWGSYGLVKYTIPWIINKIKTALFQTNRSKFIALSNAENTLFNMGNQVIFLIGTTVSILFLFSFDVLNLDVNTQTKAFEISTIIAYGIIQIIIGISITYNIISHAYKRVSSFKQLLLVGYLKKNIYSAIRNEIIAVFTIVLVICGMPILAITIPNMISGLYVSSFGKAILLETVITPIVLTIITYISYKKIVEKKIGGK